jgi:hypothetical protein
MWSNQRVLYLIYPANIDDVHSEWGILRLKPMSSWLHSVRLPLGDFSASKAVWCRRFPFCHGTPVVTMGFNMFQYQVICFGLFWSNPNWTNPIDLKNAGPTGLDICGFNLRLPVYTHLVTKGTTKVAIWCDYCITWDCSKYQKKTHTRWFPLVYLQSKIMQCLDMCPDPEKTIHLWVQ